MARRYTEDEVRAILALATQEGTETEPRPSSSTAVRRTTGTSLDELVEIGREVGIDRAALERAATRVDHLVSRIGDGPAHTVAAHHRVEGELSGEDLDDLVAKIRRWMGREKSLELTERGFTIEIANTMGFEYINVRRRKGGTEIDVDFDTQTSRALTVLGGGAISTGLAFVLAAIGNSFFPQVDDAWLIVLIAGALGGGWATDKWWWKNTFSRYRDRIARLAGRLRDEVETLVDSPTESLPPGDSD